MFKKIFIFLLLVTILGATIFFFYDEIKKIIPAQNLATIKKIINGKNIGIWCGKKQCFWFDERGVLTKPAPRPEGRLIILVNETKGETDINKPFLKENFWKNFKSILNSWMIEEWMINRFTIDKSKKEGIAKTDNFDIYFSLRFNPENNLKALKKIIEEKINTNNLSYIDLRVENKIYFR